MTPVYRSILLLAVATAGCTLLRHDYYDKAEQASAFLELLADSTATVAGRHEFYTAHLAPAVTAWDSSAARIIDSLLNIPVPDPELISIHLRGAIITKIVRTVESLPGLRDRDVHTDRFWQLKYLYGVLAPTVRHLSAWSARDDLDARCAFQLERLELFPFSVSSVKAANAFLECLDRVVLLDLQRHLYAVAKSPTPEAAAAWQQSRAGYRYLRPRIAAPVRQQVLDALFSVPAADADIPATRAALSRALPMAVEKVDVKFNAGG